MEDKRFDLLTKSLSSGISRRSLLRSLAAAVGVAAVGAEVTSAAPGGVNGTRKCYGSGSLCTNAKQCCSGMCINRVCAPEVDLCATTNCDDGNDCTIDSCVAGNCTYTPAEKGRPCEPGGYKHCDATGQCVAPQMCNPGAIEECYTGDPATYNVGICKGGFHECDPTGMGWGPCIDEVLPSQEICGSGLDEDCNGVVDNGCGGEPCMVADDCQYMDTTCQTRTCIDQICGFDYAAAGTLLPPEEQFAFCQVLICDGAGNVMWQPDDNDLPPAKPCVKYFCANGAYDYTLDPAGTLCTDINGQAGQCDGQGACTAT
jgi:hypothetical protein